MLSSMSKPTTLDNMQLPMAISTITSPNTSGENISTSSSSSCSSSPTIVPESHYLYHTSDIHAQNLRDKIHSLPAPSSSRGGLRRNSSSGGSSRALQQQDYYASACLDDRRISCSSMSPPPSSPTSSLPLTAPLSLQERRERNKAASAKYRAKKNQQHGEMKSVITSLTRENELLQRQLDYIRHENNQLKETCDQLRGKIMAQKMIQQMMVEDNYDIQKLKATFDLEGEHDQKNDDDDMLL